jgi:hydroxymethylglutaryl-CoA lyase
MSDTPTVMAGLDMKHSGSKLLAIVANVRGATDAAHTGPVSFLGYPFSVSETFQLRNTNATIGQSLEAVKTILQVCGENAKHLVVYISMGFGNPYGDPYSPGIVYDWVDRLTQLGVGTISLADTVGVATPDQVNRLAAYLVEKLPAVEIGVHLHSRFDNWREKLDAAFNAGCRRFDGALKGIGGCPMANDTLVGNMNTEWMITYFAGKGVLPALDGEALDQSLNLASSIFV